MLNLIIRFVLWIYGWIVCRIFKIHHNKTIAVRFARQVEMVPHMTRIVLRYTDRKCALCGARSTRTDRARVAHDWQHPERLFK